MMFKLNKYAIYLIILLFMAGCREGFNQINTDPRQPVDIKPGELLSTVITKTAYEWQNFAFMDHGGVAGRYITMVRNESMDKFNWGPMGWNEWYRRLSINRQLILKAGEHREPQYRVLGKILAVINYAYLTDLWGDIPYSEALLADEGYPNPKYDLQEFIYKDLIKTLDSCNNWLSNPLPAIDAQYDVLFHGDVIAWRRLANSLRLRLLLRCSQAYPEAAGIMKEMVSDEDRYPLILDRAADATVDYLGLTAENSWPGSDIANSNDEFDKRKPSKDLVDSLRDWEDPRLPILISPVNKTKNATIDTNLYVGVPNAIQDPFQYNGGNDHISHFAAVFNQAKSDLCKAVIFTNSETWFILAEISLRGWVDFRGMTTEALYKKAVTASMEYWGTAPGEKYFKKKPVKFDGTIRQLITQKWVSLLFNGDEGWMEHRRTGYPAFKLGPLAMQPSIPLRFMYPEDEILFNSAAYNQAKINMGGDGPNTKMWLIR